jgi:hypothetical protein
MKNMIKHRSNIARRPKIVIMIAIHVHVVVLS